MKELIPTIRKVFGLNLYEAKIWLALLSKGIATAGELSTLAGVPRSRAYDILESLERKGFVVAKLGRPLQYIALHPKDVIERAKKNFLEEAKAKCEELDRFRDSPTMKKLEDIFNKTAKTLQIEEVAGALKGRLNIYAYLDSLIRNANQSIYVLTSDEGLIRKFDHFKDAFAKAKERNVDIRIIVPLTERNSKYVEELRKVAKIAHLDEAHARFIIIDRKHAILLASDKEVSPHYDAGIWVSESSIARQLSEMFEHFWEKAKK